MPERPARQPGGGNLRGRSVLTWARDWPDLAPVTIVRLERWVAFPTRPRDLPDGYEAPGFLTSYAGPHGTGDSPDAAYLDLARRLSS